MRPSLLLAVIATLPLTAQAGTVTSKYSIDPGVISLEGEGDFDILGGMITIQYDALGTKTPDTAGTGRIVSGTFSLSGPFGTGAQLNLLPASGASVTGSPSSVGLLSFPNVFATGTVAGSSFALSRGVFNSFSLFASLPTSPALGSLTSLTFTFDQTAGSASVNTVYLSYGALSGQEISRTFVPEPHRALLLVPAFLGVLAAAAWGSKRKRSA